MGLDAVLSHMKSVQLRVLAGFVQLQGPSEGFRKFAQSNQYWAQGLASCR